MAAIPFPDLDVLEDAHAVVMSVNGALGVLASYIEDQPDLGTDMPHAAYAAGFALDHAALLLASGIDALATYREEISYCKVQL